MGTIPGTYVLTGISDQVCSNTANGSEIIEINPIPSAPNVLKDSSYCSNWELAEMVIESTNGTFNWYNQDGELLSTGQTLLPFNTIGSTQYFVTNVLSNCESEATIITITIEDCEITVPTAFTPDGDGTNDYWELLDLDQVYPNNLVQIYNRWGNLIYESKQGAYSIEPWDGTFNGNSLPVGSYYYIIDYKEKESKPNKGIVSIVKD